MSSRAKELMRMLIDEHISEARRTVIRCAKEISGREIFFLRDLAECALEANRSRRFRSVSRLWYLQKGAGE